MPTSKLRIAAVALAATAGLATAGTAVSQAAVVKAAPGTVRPVLTQQRPQVAELKVDAGATGDGPATDADCQQYAGIINDAIDLAQNELNENGMTSRWEHYTDTAIQVQNIAEDEGCFIVNPV